MKEDKHLETVDHSLIRYANVWEDPILLIEGLDIRQDHRVLSIASAGDNVFAIAAQGPDMVVAIDLNWVQLHVVELKKVAISQLEREEFIRFIGFRPGEDRLATYKALRPELSEKARIHWDKNQETIRKGIVLSGKFEKYLATFAKKVLPFIHTKQRVQELFRSKSPREQAQFYTERWDTWRWRFLFRLFFNRKIMGMLGRDPAFLKQVKGSVSKTIYRKTGEHLSSVYAQKNPFLKYCLTGNFGDDLPYYLQEENYLKVKRHIEVIHLEHGYAQDAAVKYGKFHRFNLSNIFEYMPSEVFQFTAQSLVESAEQGARFAYWNLMVDRVMSEEVHGLQRIEDQEHWAERDKGFFYMQFVLERLER